MNSVNTTNGWKSGIKRLAAGLLAVGLVTSLSACGGGGGGGSTAILGPNGAYSFQPTLISSAPNRVVLTLDLAASTETKAVFGIFLDSAGASLNLATDSIAVSGELSFNSSWMTFNAVTLTGGTANDAAAAVDASNANKLLLAFTDVQEGKIGSVSFDVSGTGNAATLAFTNTMFVGNAATVVADQAITAFAGALTS